jgi:hypothetical protein
MILKLGGWCKIVLQPLQPQNIAKLDASKHKNQIASLIASIASCENLLSRSINAPRASNDKMQWLQRMQDRLQSKKIEVERPEKAKNKGCNGCNAISKTKRGRN